MFGKIYDISTIIDAVLSFAIFLLTIRFALYLANRKRTRIQKPDWLDTDRFDTKKRK